MSDMVQTPYSVSIVIPTLNAEQHIRNLLESLLSQTVRSEILVIDSSSRDRTVEIAQSLRIRTELIGRDVFDHGGTRNLGVAMTSGDIVVFLTQDVVPAGRDLIGNLVQPFQDERVALSYGRQVAKADATPVERFTRSFNYPGEPHIKGRADVEKLGIKTFYCSNACSAIRRRAFDEVGGFPSPIIMNEDMMMAAKLIIRGYSIAYQSSAAVFHSHNYSLLEQCRRYFDIGVSLDRNRWVLGYARPEGEGLRFMREQARSLLGTGQWYWIPYGIAEGIVKLLGYRLGLNERRIPRWMTMGLTMHRHFWKNSENPERPAR